MVEDFASCAYSAHSGAGVDAFLIHASSIAGTFCADYTFWPTTRGCTLEIGQAGATGLTIDIATLTIRAAG